MTDQEAYPAGPSHDAGSLHDVGDPGRAPVLVAVLGAVVAFAVCAATFAVGQVGVGITAVSVGLLVFSAGLSWLGMDRRRMREAERQLLFCDRAGRR